MSDVITAIYLWPDSSPMPDGILLKDASSLGGNSLRMESYGRNSLHYAQMKEAEEKIAMLEREVMMLKESV